MNVVQAATGNTPLNEAAGRSAKKAKAGKAEVELRADQALCANLAAAFAAVVGCAFALIEADGDGDGKVTQVAASAVTVSAVTEAFVNFPFRGAKAPAAPVGGAPAKRKRADTAAGQGAGAAAASKPTLPFCVTLSAFGSAIALAATAVGLRCAPTQKDFPTAPRKVHAMRPPAGYDLRLRSKAEFVAQLLAASVRIQAPTERSAGRGKT